MLYCSESEVDEYHRHCNAHEVDDIQEDIECPEIVNFKNSFKEGRHIEDVDGCKKDQHKEETQAHENEYGLCHLSALKDYGAENIDQDAADPECIYL